MALAIASWLVRVREMHDRIHPGQVLGHSRRISQIDLSIGHPRLVKSHEAMGLRYLARPDPAFECVRLGQLTHNKVR
jgi:hypothetical protein